MLFDFCHLSSNKGRVWELCATPFRENNNSQNLPNSKILKRLQNKNNGFRAWKSARAAHLHQTVHCALACAQSNIFRRSSQDPVKPTTVSCLTTLHMVSLLFNKHQTSSNQLETPESKDGPRWLKETTFRSDRFHHFQAIIQSQVQQVVTLVMRPTRSWMLVEVLRPRVIADGCSHIPEIDGV